MTDQHAAHDLMDFIDSIRGRLTDQEYLTITRIAADIHTTTTKIQEYVVQEIIDHGLNDDGELVFLVKYADADAPTWQPVADVADCQAMDDYLTMYALSEEEQLAFAMQQ